MIDDILDLSKIEAGRMVLREETVDPETLVDGVVRLMQAKVVANDLTLDRGDRRHGWGLTCDPRLVRQMLLNLVGNAVKFTPDGGTLAIACEPTDEGGIAIVVADTGPGMGADQLAQALRPFETADARVARPGEAQGTGLGLFLVDRMMRLHGGALAIDTAPGQGLTARLVFPAERCLTADADAAGD
jgi:two-component system cell cycle sensor histidine kinase PleC